VADVRKADFVPMPVVDSSLVEIRMKEVRPPGISLDEWFEFTHVCFGKHQLQQRKKKKKRRA
jgi:18S rRNA (adenine1779-N6/adenine1780-N6)-dimethyltransferase